MSQPNKIKNLRDYFAEMRKRPGMFLGKNTISKLHDHLQGYKMAYWFNDINNEVDKNFFENFNAFVYEYYGDINCISDWKGVILEQCFGNEEGALITFFELYDLFDAGVKSVDSKRIVLAVLDKVFFAQVELKEQLGSDFAEVLSITVDLFKDNLIANLKSDYDFVWEQLEEKAAQIVPLRTLLKTLSEEQF